MKNPLILFPAGQRVFLFGARIAATVCALQGKDRVARFPRVALARNDVQGGRVHWGLNPPVSLAADSPL